MAQTTTKPAGTSRSNRNARRAGSMTANSRTSSKRSSGVKSSNARPSTKGTGSRRKSAGRVSAVARSTRDVKNKSINGRVRAVTRRGVGAVARKAKGLGAVGRAASRAKGVAALGAVGLAGLAGGIGLNRWNNSYSRTQAFARRWRGRR
jgi:hypothetical protein